MISAINHHVIFGHYFKLKWFNIYFHKSIAIYFNVTYSDLEPVKVIYFQILLPESSVG